MAFGVDVEVGLIVNAENISEMSKLEKELKEFTEELEDKRLPGLRNVPKCRPRLKC